MLSWLIVGGGLQGTHLSLVLTKGLGVGADQVRVLDTEEEPLARWFHYTQNTGMMHLRSPMVHHLDLDAGSLKDFSRKWREDRLFIPPYARPRLSMFNAHCRDVIRRNGLDQIRIQGAAQRIALDKRYVQVETDQGVIRTKRVILAVGSPRPSMPEWAEQLSAAGASIHHLFAMDFEGSTLDPSGTTLVVGGGISGAQYASLLVEQGAEQVIVMSRSQPRIHQFDSDPGWLGPKYMTGFMRLEPTARRPLITAARHKGSMPSDVNRRMRNHMKQGALTWVEGDVSHAKVTEDGRIEVQNGDEHLIVDRMVLATGFTPTVPGRSMLQDLHEREGLPLASCGFPLTDQFLRWHPRIFATGGLGELTLGPSARNIAGARRAGSLIKQLMKRS